MLAPFSLTPIIDTNGDLIRSARLQVFLAGTTTPAVLYKAADYANGTEHPNPIPVTGAGILPAMYGAGSFKFRALTSTGAIVWEADGITLTDPPKADDAQGDNLGLLSTGQIAQFYGTGSRAGFVRMNGRTIGNAASGATERSAADTRALYLMLWSEDDSLVVNGGRGQTAAQDFDAGKSLALPYAPGKILVSMDGMGAPAQNVFPGLSWNSGGSGTRLGSRSGGWTATIGISQLPPHNHEIVLDVQPGGGFTVNGQTSNVTQDHLHGVGVTNYSAASGAAYQFLGVFGGPADQAPAQSATTTSSQTHSHTFQFSQPDHDHAINGLVISRGDGNPLAIANPILLVTTYLKL